MKKSSEKSKSKKKLSISYEKEDKPLIKNFKLNNISKKLLAKSSTEKIIKSRSKLEMLKQYEDDNEKLLVTEKAKPRMKDTFWEEWESIEKMRNYGNAPVDTMGVEYCHEPETSRAVFKFQTLIGLLLSSQTKDPITFTVMNKLIKHGLTVENINKSSEEEIRDLIYGVSFYNNKAKYIKKLCTVLIEDYNSDPPEQTEDVLKLPGIGPKMAFLYLQCCCDKIEGIAVDTHVHRISNRLKWVMETKSPEHTRKDLEEWLPQKFWADINLLLVGFGQTICAAVAPKCEECLLNTTCEFGIERLKNKSMKKNSKKRKNENDSKDTTILSSKRKKK